MTATTQKVQLKFRCDQDVDKMAVGANGKPFCEMCQKSLVDFRTKSLKEVVAYTKEKSGCGVFKAEHVESDEIIIILSFASFRKYFLAIGTFLMAETSYSQAMSDSLGETPVNITKQDSIYKTEDVKIKNKYLKHGIVFKRATYSRKGRFTRPQKSQYEYGIFVRRKFPFLSFRRMSYVPKIHGLWSMYEK